MKFERQVVNFWLTAVVASAAQATGVIESEKVYVQQGDKLLQEDQIDRAIDSYKQALRIEPSSALAHQRMGHALSLNGKLESAIDEEHRALQLDPGNSDAHCNLGWIYGVQQKYRAAIDEARLSIALNQNNASAYSILGLSLASIESYDLAVSSFEKAIQLDPNDSSTFLNLAAALGRKGDYAKAVTIYSRAIKLDRSDAAAYVGMGAALGKLGDLKGQIEAYRTAVALAPTSPGNHGKLGWALSQAGDWRSAFREGIVANGLRLKSSSSQFIRMFLTAWAAIFVAFGLLFTVVFSGSKFKPQQGESVRRSFFLTFYKEKPGRFVLTNRRLVFVPEAFSQWFGSTRLSIELDQIDKVESRVTVGGGKLMVLLLNGNVYQFSMPNLVLEPVTKELKAIAADDAKKQTEMADALAVPSLVEAGQLADGVGNEAEPAAEDKNQSTIEVTLGGESSTDDSNAVIITVVPPSVVSTPQSGTTPDDAASNTESEPVKTENVELAQTDRLDKEQVLEKAAVTTQSESSETAAQENTEKTIATTNPTQDQTEETVAKAEPDAASQPKDETKPTTETLGALESKEPPAATNVSTAESSEQSSEPEGTPGGAAEKTGTKKSSKRKTKQTKAMSPDIATDTASEAKDSDA